MMSHIRYESEDLGIYVIYEGGVYADVFTEEGKCVDTINVFDYESGQAVDVTEREARIIDYFETFQDYY